MGGVESKKEEEVMEPISDLEEYYSLEDYQNFIVFQKCLKTTNGMDLLHNLKLNINKNRITKTTIKVYFLVNGHPPKVIFSEKKILNKIYSFSKIYSDNNHFIKIIINRAENYDTNEILNKINNFIYYKDILKTHFNIDEYPIKTYCLEEKKISNEDVMKSEIEKEFFIKKLKISNNINNMHQNIINNNNIPQNLNLIMKDMSNINSINFNNSNNIDNQNFMNFNFSLNNNNFQIAKNNMNQINFNLNFSNNNDINNNFEKNYMNLMSNSNIIEYINNKLINNKFLFLEIINYIQKNNFNLLSNDLLNISINLNQFNNIITPNNFNYMNIMKQNIFYLISIIKNNYIDQNNNNYMSQMIIFLQPIISSLNKIYNNLNNIINLLNNDYRQIDIINNCKNNNIDNSNKINEKEKENENEKDNIDIVDNPDEFKFFTCNEEYESYFPLFRLKRFERFSYINSILQCLLHIPELIYYFINIFPEHKNKFKKINNNIYSEGSFSEEFHTIFQEIYNLSDYDKNLVRSRNFISFLEIKKNYSQYKGIDAKDFLSFLFQVMHTELNYRGDTKLKHVPKCNRLIEKESFNFFKTVNNNLNVSIISYLFYGTLKSTLSCNYCKKTIYNFQYFQYLSFPLFNFQKKYFNIYQGFKEFIKPELLTGDHQCYCLSCKCLRNWTVTNKIYSAPPYLIINLDYGKNKEFNPLKIDFGRIIDINNFVDKFSKFPSIKYKLIAVSTYIGQSLKYGHYISYCKNSEDKWYEFNDSHITESQFVNVNSNSPHILIYKKL